MQYFSIESTGVYARRKILHCIQKPQDIRHGVFDALGVHRLDISIFAYFSIRQSPSHGNKIRLKRSILSKSILFPVKFLFSSIRKDGNDQLDPYRYTNCHLNDVGERNAKDTYNCSIHDPDPLQFWMSSLRT